MYGGQLVNEEMIFGSCGSIVFVIDAQDEPYGEALARLHETVQRAHRYNPDIFFEVFIHKVDGDLFLSDDHKIGMPFHANVASVRLPFVYWVILFLFTL